LHIDLKTSKLDIAGMWARKRSIVSACPGLSFYTGPETLKDAGGLTNIKNYLTQIHEWKKEGRKSFSVSMKSKKHSRAAGTDTSGVKGDLLGNFLSWVEDKKVVCTLFLGVPGRVEVAYYLLSRW